MYGRRLLSKVAESCIDTVGLLSVTILFVFFAVACETPGGAEKRQATGAEETASDEEKADEEAEQEEEDGFLPDPVDDLQTSVTSPKRIVLLVGDGMGVGQVTAGMHAVNRPLNLQTMPRLNFLTTHSYEFVTTDSAAAATALATGAKTHYEGLSVKPGTTESEETKAEFQLGTVLESAEQRGWRSGLVATSEIVHATPAAFASHRAGRHSYADIARDMAGSGVDVMLGAGFKYFQGREDGADLLGGLKKQGYSVATTPEQIRKASKSAKRLVGLYRPDALPPVQKGSREMTLAEMTKRALDVLDRGSPKGWFLMVEGSQIDWEGHALDGPGTVAETLSYDRAVGVALEYARQRDDTLVISVADHETGGLSVVEPSATAPVIEQQGGRSEIEENLDYPGEEGDAPSPMANIERGSEELGEAVSDVQDLGLPESVKGNFQTVWGHLSQASRPLSEGPGSFWGTHTPELVPMYLEGQGAQYIEETLDNAELGERLTDLVEKERVRTRKPKKAKNSPDQIIVYIGEGMGLGTWSTATYLRRHTAVRSAKVRGMFVPTTDKDDLVPTRREAMTALFGGTPNTGQATAVGRARVEEVDVGLVTTTELDAAPVRTMAGLESDQSGSLLYGDRGIFNRAITARSSDTSDEFSRGLQGRESRYRNVDYREFGESGEAGDSVGQEVTLRDAVDRMLEETKGLDGKSLVIVYDDRPGEMQDARIRTEALPKSVAAFDAAVSRGLESAHRRDDVMVAVTAPRTRTLSVLDNHYGFTKKTACAVAERCGGPFELIELTVPGPVQKARAGWSDRSLQGDYAPPTLFVQYAWPAQVADGKRGAIPSADAVPLFATGPGASALRGTHPQRKLGDVLTRWVQNEDK